ncbi:putative efflux protein, MATE family [Desulfonispora thiosulfatigenes DSM 11270]|uniref:Multidrug export protein MepA n=2 Tax=Desulfonispora thiosulfatigenes TaxID=83661 RepID=A0A1W1V6W1_DESTI|nr:putative efflux protein, MATE family [Desulfonispora thiosulfatigenes DSM 11270]
MVQNKPDLRNDKVLPLLFKLSLPIIMAQLVNLLYNVVDRIYIGRMANGEIAMAGVGVALPIIIIVAAFSGLIGMGGAPLVAIKMGEGDNDGAEKILSNSFVTLIIISVILTSAIILFKSKIVWLFGASTTTVGYTLDYLTIYMLGTISVQIALGMNPFINTQGFTKIGMKTVMIGAVANIILDPIFIFGLNMGVKGAALATVIAQTLSAIWVLKFLISGESKLKIRKAYLIPEFKIMKSVIALGISPFVMQSTESLVLISLNNMLMLHGGDLAVSAMTIMSSIMQMILLPVVGLSNGAQPIISYNFGARQFDRVQAAFKILVKSALCYTVVIYTLLMTLPHVFVLIFNNDPALLKIATWSIRIYFAGIFALGVQISCQMTFIALGKARISILLALLRKVILLIPLIFILPHFCENKPFGVLLAAPIADITASITTGICFAVFYKKKLSLTKEIKPEAGLTLTHSGN